MSARVGDSSASSTNHSPSIVLALVTATLLSVSAACNRAEHVSSNQNAPPRLELDAARVALRGMVAGKKQTVQVPVRNAGQGTLEIGRVERSRFCSAKPTSSVLAGGQQGRLLVECLADLHGRIEERITIHSNDARHPEFELVLEGTVEPQLAFAPQVVAMNLDFGQEKSQDVLLRGAAQSAARVELERGAVPGVSRIEPLLTEAGKVRGYRLTCTGEKVGLHATSLLVTTHLRRPERLTLSYSCRVEGSLDVSDSNPYFDLSAPGIKRKLLRVRSRQPDFVVHRVEVLDGPFEATLRPRAVEGSFPVEIRVLDDQIGENARSATGTLLIVSNDATEPRREIRLLGFGRVNPSGSPSTTSPP